MKFGLQLHLERGADAVLREARQADDQGFDSVWLFDHLVGLGGTPSADGPLDPFTLMVAVGAVTTRVRMAWAMLNPTFRYPAVLAKMLTTLDQISHGRVICSLGAGWMQQECDAYGIPFISDHDARIDQEREVLRLFLELWAHPAPEKVTFHGTYVHTQDLAFNPAPYQKPRLPVWIGGESPATMALVKELADGWVALSSATADNIAQLRSAPDWPARPITIVKGQQVFVAESARQAREMAEAAFAQRPQRAGGAITLEDFLEREVVGTPDECQRRIGQIAATGVDYLRLTFLSEEHQHRFAHLLLPRF